MKLRDLPRWLAGDVIAFVGVLVTLLSAERAFTSAYARLERENRRQFNAAEFSLLARLLAVAESWLSYAIARRAFRLAGFKRAHVKRTEPAPPTDDSDFIRRASDYLRGVGSMNEQAEAMAARIIRAMLDTSVSGCPHRHSAAPNATSPAFQAREEIRATKADLFLPRSRSGRGRWIDASSRRDGGGSRRLLESGWRSSSSSSSSTNTHTHNTREGLRVRAPPWLELDLEKPRPTRPADPISEVAPVWAYNVAPSAASSSR